MPASVSNGKIFPGSTLARLPSTSTAMPATTSRTPGVFRRRRTRRTASATTARHSAVGIATRQSTW